MSTFIYPAQQVTISGAATEATLLLVETNTADTVTELQTLNAVDFATEASLAQVVTNTAASAQETTAQSQLTELQTANSNLSSIDSLLSDIESNTNSINARLDLAPIDQIDTTPLLDTSITNIPASSSAPVEIVASAFSDIQEVVSVEDIGSFIGLYLGAASSEVLHVVLPLGGGSIEVQIPGGERISLRAMENVAITSGKIAINFLG